MTRLAFDAERRMLVRVWPTVQGDLSSDVVAAGREVSEEAALKVARAFARLSRTFWRSCTHPASADLPRTDERSGAGLLCLRRHK